MDKTDWRGLCEELVEFVARLTKHYYEPAESLVRARAVLAQPEPEVVGPTLQLPEQAPDEHPPSNLDRREIAAWYHGHACGWQAARAVLSRWGRPAPAPAGEVAKLVQPPGRAGLTWQGVIEGLRDVLNDESEDAIQRVWQRSRILDAISVMEANPCPAPVPVAVSERLPGDALCWWFEADEDCGYGNTWTLLRIRGSATGYTHWLPAHALPLPSGEAE